MQNVLVDVVVELGFSSFLAAFFVSAISIVRFLTFVECLEYVKGN